LGQNIAVIDDDVVVRRALEYCIESEGYVIRGFGSAERGAAGFFQTVPVGKFLNHYRSGHPALIQRSPSGPSAGLIYM
jgi:hypothetical protein